MTFSSSTGRAVHDFLFGSQRRAARTSVAEQFLPRRTAFLYELEDVLAPDAPTTLRRSKDDCPVPREKLSGGLDAAVLERMAKIMAYMTVAGGCCGAPGLFCRYFNLIGSPKLPRMCRWGA